MFQHVTAVNELRGVVRNEIKFSYIGESVNMIKRHNVNVIKARYVYTSTPEM